MNVALIWLKTVKLITNPPLTTVESILNLILDLNQTFDLMLIENCYILNFSSIGLLFNRISLLRKYFVP